MKILLWCLQDYSTKHSNVSSRDQVSRKYVAKETSKQIVHKFLRHCFEGTHRFLSYSRLKRSLLCTLHCTVSYHVSGNSVDNTQRTSAITYWDRVLYLVADIRAERLANIRWHMYRRVWILLWDGLFCTQSYLFVQCGVFYYEMSFFTQSYHTTRHVGFRQLKLLRSP